MDTVLVTGGTGHLGHDVVTLLKADYQVRVLSRSPGTDPAIEWVQGDLATGEGIIEAVAGAKIVVHAATQSPIATRGYPRPADFRHSPPDVDVDATRRLLELSAQAAVSHFLYVSVVGAGRPLGPYMKLKHTAEELVRISEVPWSILRATEFHWLTDRLLAKAARLPVLPSLRGVHTQPVATADFAEYLVSCLKDGPGWQREDFAGPEVLPMRTLVEKWQQARASSRRIVSVPAPSRLRRAANAITAPNGRRGVTTWEEWLRAHPHPQ